MERLYSIAEIVKKLDIPMERLRDCMHRGFVHTSDQQTKAIFNRLDVYGIALFAYLITERFISSEEAAKFTKLWLQTTNGAASKNNLPTSDGPHAEDPSNMLVFIYIATDAGRELLCEPVGIHGSKESKEGFHFFKALGDVLRKKFQGKSWDDFCLVNIGRIKRHVDAQLS